MKNKLRLLLTDKCNRNCEGCCNNDWNLSALPIVKTFAGFSEILLTGGEPMLFPDIIFKTIRRIKNENIKAAIYLYTADVTKIDDLICLLDIINGVCITLHEQSDVELFYIFNSYLNNSGINLKRLSLRLNVFKGINVDADENNWKTKNNMKWIKNCPLPKNEIFMRRL